MPVANFIVTSLPAYVEENRDLLLKNFGLVGGSIRNRIGIQTGIKLKEHLNYLEVAPTLQDGSVCELEPAGDVTLTNREIETAWIEVLIAICPKKLIGKWAEYLVRANANAESLPFEQYIIDGFIAEVNKKIDVLIFQGDKTLTTNPNLKWIDGFIKVFQADGTQVTASQGATTILAKLQELYAGMDDYTLNRGAEIYVSPANTGHSSWSWSMQTCSIIRPPNPALSPRSFSCRELMSRLSSPRVLPGSTMLPLRLSRTT